MKNIRDELRELNLKFKPPNIATGFITQEHLKKVSFTTFFEEIGKIASAYRRKIKYMKFSPSPNGKDSIVFEVNIPPIKTRRK